MDEKQKITTWIKLKLSEIILQILVVMFSILIALAVDEWRSTNTQHHIADQSHKSILREIQENQKELKSGIDSNDSVLTVLIGQIKSNAVRKEGISFSYVQLSTAAWQIAQGTQSLHLIDFSRLIKIAQLYEFQSLYNVSQSKFVNDLGESWLGGKEADLKKIQRKGAIQLATICQLAHELNKQYSSILCDSTSIKTE